MDLALEAQRVADKNTRYWLGVLTRDNPLLQDKPWKESEVRLG